MLIKFYDCTHNFSCCCSTMQSGKVREKKVLFALFCSLKNNPSTLRAWNFKIVKTESKKFLSRDVKILFIMKVERMKCCRMKMNWHCAFPLNKKSQPASLIFCMPLFLFFFVSSYFSHFWFYRNQWSEWRKRKKFL